MLPCCYDMPGRIRRDDDVRGFSTQGGMVKKPPFGSETGPTSGDRPPMG